MKLGMLGLMFLVAVDDVFRVSRGFWSLVCGRVLIMHVGVCLKWRTGSPTLLSWAECLGHLGCNCHVRIRWLES